MSTGNVPAWSTLSLLSADFLELWLSKLVSFGTTYACLQSGAHWCIRYRTKYSRDKTFTVFSIYYLSAIFFCKLSVEQCNLIQVIISTANFFGECQWGDASVKVLSLEYFVLHGILTRSWKDICYIMEFICLIRLCVCYRSEPDLG